jgi:hypothetical protein
MNHRGAILNNSNLMARDFYYTSSGNTHNLNNLLNYLYCSDFASHRMTFNATVTYAYMLWRNTSPINQLTNYSIEFIKDKVFRLMEGTYDTYSEHLTGTWVEVLDNEEISY